MSDADFCEVNKETADKISYIGAKNIAEVCRDIDTKLINMSSVYVFDGKKVIILRLISVDQLIFTEKQNLKLNRKFWNLIRMLY